jgi:hypothetical protein
MVQLGGGSDSEKARDEQREVPYRATIGLVLQLQLRLCYF